MFILHRMVVPSQPYLTELSLIFRTKFGLCTICFSIVDPPIFVRSLGHTLFICAVSCTFSLPHTRFWLATGDKIAHFYTSVQGFLGGLGIVYRGQPKSAGAEQQIGNFIVSNV
jgi:hypothetical protein